MRDESIRARLASRGHPPPRVRLPHGSSPESESRGHAGRFEIHGELARGDTEIVLRGRDTDLGRDVSLHILTGEPSRSPDAVRGFVARARAAGRLQHPGVVPVYGLGVTEAGCPFVVRRLRHGETLETVLAAAVERATLLPVFEQVCQAVAYAHGQGVVHGHLDAGEVTIGTFGEVEIGGWLGCGEPADDVRSLARILRAMLAGAATGDGTLQALADECLSDRSPTSDEVARRVAAYLADAEARAHRAGLRLIEERAGEERARGQAEMALAEAAVLRRARRRLIALAVAVCLLVLVAGGGFLILDRAGAERTRRARGAVEQALAEAGRLGAEGRTAEAARSAAGAVVLAEDELVDERLRSAAHDLAALTRRDLAAAQVAAEKAAKEARLHDTLEERRTRRELDPPEVTARACRAAMVEYGADLTDVGSLVTDPRAEDVVLALADLGRLGDEPALLLARRASAGLPASRVLDAAAGSGSTGLLALAELETPPAPALLGGLLVDRGEIAAGLRVLSAASARRPDDPEVHRELARAFLARDPPDGKRAARHLAVAVTLRPGSAGLRLLHARALDLAGEAEAAAGERARARELDAAFAAAHGD